MTRRLSVAVALAGLGIAGYLTAAHYAGAAPVCAVAHGCAEVVQEARDNGINKPVVASLVGDVEVEQACDYLYERGIVALPYTTELPVAVLGAKYRWARAAGVI